MGLDILRLPEYMATMRLLLLTASLLAYLILAWLGRPLADGLAIMPDGHVGVHVHRHEGR